MICPDCRGRGFVPLASHDDGITHGPCGTCGGSGIASCCDAAGSAEMSPAIKRLIDEVRAEGASSANSYNRFYNRHNRS